MPIGYYNIPQVKNVPTTTAIKRTPLPPITLEEMNNTQSPIPQQTSPAEDDLDETSVIDNLENLDPDESQPPKETNEGGSSHDTCFTKYGTDNGDTDKPYNAQPKNVFINPEQYHESKTNVKEETYRAVNKSRIPNI